jgi:methionyl-tRNA formyltransferase
MALVEDSHFEVVGVVSQPDRPAGRQMKLQESEVAEYARSQGLKVLKPESAKAPEFLESIKKWGAECAVVVAYGQILNREFLKLFPKKVVNVHASLLPRWRGAAPIQRAIMAGDRETGVCLQVMTRKLDAGDVLGSRKIAIDDEMNALELHDAMIPMAQSLLTIDFMDYMRGNLSASPQDEFLVTYAKKIEKNESAVDWTVSAREIQQRQRGLMMGPGAATKYKGKTLKLLKTRALSGSASKKPPGTVIDVQKTFFSVQCGSGSLQILEVQPESRAQQSVEQFLLGHPLTVGDVFGGI